MPPCQAEALSPGPSRHSATLTNVSRDMLWMHGRHTYTPIPQTSQLEPSPDLGMPPGADPPGSETWDVVSLCSSSASDLAPPASSEVDPWSLEVDESGGSQLESPHGPSGGAGAACAAPVAPAGRRKRGRPEGLATRLAKRRVARRAEAGCEQQCSEGGDAAVGAQHGDALARKIRPLGAGLFRQCAAIVREGPAGDPGGLALLLDTCVGLVPRGAAPVWAEARMLDLPRRRLPAVMRRAGATIYWACRLAVSSLVSNLMSKVVAGVYEPICCVMHSKYDETPLPMRCPETPIPATERVRVLERQVLDPAPRCQYEPGRGSSKLYQAALRIAFAVRDVRDGRFLSVEVPLITPLLVADTNSADVLAHIMGKMSDIPMLEPLLESFKLRCRTANCDSAESNMKYQRFEACQDLRALCFTIRCRVHILSTIQGKAYLPCGWAISGLIALALAMQPSGAVFKLRRILEQHLRDNVVVFASEPPGPTDPRTVRRDALLQVCLGGPGSGKPREQKRRLVLETLCNGDWSAKAVQYYTLEPAPDLEAWSQRVARALLPEALALFPRHRWLNTLRPLLDSALLSGCHQILEHIVPAWLSPGGAAASTQSGQARGPPQTEKDPWDLDVDAGEDLEGLLDRPRTPGKGGDWAKFNEESCGDAARFAASKPFATLAVSSIALRPQVGLMAEMLRVAGQRWKEEQAHLSAQTGAPLLTRLSLAASGEMLGPFFLDSASLLLRSSEWVALPASEQTFKNRALAFGMLSRALCGVHINLHMPCQAYPVRLWSLVNPAGEAAREATAADLQSDPDCMCDEFGRAYRKHFHNRLASEESVVCLTLIGLLVDLDISEQECLHAYVRRVLRGRNQTWKKTAEEVSADWSMARARSLEAGTWWANEGRDSCVHAEAAAGSADTARSSHRRSTAADASQQAPRHTAGGGPEEVGGRRPSAIVLLTVLVRADVSGRCV